MSQRDGQMFIQHLNVEADALLGGEGVEVAADGIDLRAISSAVRVWVPLNTMCSRKCEMPLCSACFMARAAS